LGGQYGERIEILIAAKVKAAKKLGMLADGNNLDLSVSRAGGKSWIFKFMQAGKSWEMRLGSAHDVPLAKAREKSCISATETRPLDSPEGGTRRSQHCAHWIDGV
jgi:hypothetical protein